MIGLNFNSKSVEEGPTDHGLMESPLVKPSKTIILTFSGLKKNKVKSPKTGGLIELEMNDLALMGSHKLYASDGRLIATFLMVFDPPSRSAHVLYSGREGWIASHYLAGQVLNQTNHHISDNASLAWRDVLTATVMGGDYRLMNLHVNSLGSSAK